jgi:hypothetical protein
MTGAMKSSGMASPRALGVASEAARTRSPTKGRRLSSCCGVCVGLMVVVWGFFWGGGWVGVSGWGQGQNGGKHGICWMVDGRCDDMGQAGVLFSFPYPSFPPPRQAPPLQSNISISGHHLRVQQHVEGVGGAHGGEGDDGGVAPRGHPHELAALRPEEAVVLPIVVVVVVVWVGEWVVLVVFVLWCGWVGRWVGVSVPRDEVKCGFGLCGRMACTSSSTRIHTPQKTHPTISIHTTHAVPYPLRWYVSRAPPGKRRTASLASSSA